MHLFVKPIPLGFENKVKGIFYTIKFAEDGLSLTAIMQGIKIKLNEKILGSDLYIPIVRVKLVKH